MLHIDIHRRLAKSNKIMEKIAKEFEFITPVTLEDRALFESFFNKEERHTYGNSWIYVTQGVYGIGENNLGYKYYDGENLCMLGAQPKIENTDLIMMYWIRPLGENILDVIKQYSDCIQKKHGISCYVKKLFEDQYNYLIENGFKDSKYFPWHGKIYAEDDTYPELVFDRDYSVNAIKSSKKRSNLANVLRQFNKLSKCNVLIDSKNFNTHAWHIVNQFFKNSKPKINISDPYDYYNMILSIPETKNIFKKILFINHKPTGFFILEKNEKFDITKGYALIVIRNKYKYLSDYVITKILNIIKTKHINMGGSEHQGLHNFKKKYKPVKEIQMYWVTNVS